MPHVFLNDRLLPENEALVPVRDRGFRFGDGVFDTIGVHAGVPYRFEWHMERLRRGLVAIRIPFDVSSLKPHCAELLRKNTVQDGLLRIQISRGASGSGYLPGETEPTVLIETLPRTSAPQAPVTLWLSQYRRIPSASLPVQAKLCQGLNSTLARMEAREHGCFEALQLDQEGHVCETSSANIFWLHDNILYTPSLACGALEGAMRTAILALAPYKVQETSESLQALEQAQAVCITNASWKALAVAALEPAGYGWDSAALAQRLNTALTEDIRAYAALHAAAWQKP